MRLKQFKQFLIRVMAPELHHEHQRLVQQNDGLHALLQSCYARNPPHEQADCLEALISLVSINEDGHWSTVFDADTLLPNHIQDYLHSVVARS